MQTSVFMVRSRNARTPAARLALALALSSVGACSGGASDNLGAPDTGDAGPLGSGGGPGGSGTGSGTCTESPLFSARPWGADGTDVIRGVRFDPSSGEVFFAGYSDLSRLPKAGGEPEKLGPLPGLSDGYFWITDDRLLVPYGFAWDGAADQLSVLLSLPREGGELSSLFAVPAPTSFDKRVDVDDVRVSGDDVYWIASELETKNAAASPVVWTGPHTVRKTSWRAPGTPVDLYTSTRELKALIAAGDRIYVSEQVGPDDGNDYEAKLIDASGQASTVALGGELIGADADSVFVQRIDFADPDKTGVFRFSADGSGEQRVAPGISTASGSRDGTWVFVVSIPSAATDVFEVHSYKQGGPAKNIGCVSGEDTTVHAASVGDGAALVSIHRGADQNTIVSLPL